MAAADASVLREASPLPLLERVVCSWREMADKNLAAMHARVTRER
jgi:hypothetical protein